jgi:hypothetical protein
VSGHSRWAFPEALLLSGVSGNASVTISFVNTKGLAFSSVH